MSLVQHCSKSDFPTQKSNQIDKDMPRTFPDEPFFSTNIESGWAILMDDSDDPETYYDEDAPVGESDVLPKDSPNKADKENKPEKTEKADKEEKAEKSLT